MASSTRPVIFFSHASSDSLILTQLRNLFLQKTANTIDIFMSSDGESIPFGCNWVSKIEEALHGAAVMFVFVSPSSLLSGWIYYEAGHAAGRGVAVIPVGLLGVDIGKVAAPLSLLQGFNVRSADGLNNIIAYCNRTFDMKHNPSFTEAEFESLQSGPVSPTEANITSGIQSAVLRAIIPSSGYDMKAKDFEKLKAGLPAGYSAAATSSSLMWHGAVLRSHKGAMKGGFVNVLTCEAAVSMLPRIYDDFRSLASHAVGGNLIQCVVRLEMRETVKRVTGVHQLTSVLAEDEYSWSPDGLPIMHKFEIEPNAPWDDGDRILYNNFLQLASTDGTGDDLRKAVIELISRFTKTST